MKKLISLSFVFAVLFISSCSNYRGGELTGVPGRAGGGEVPLAAVRVPGPRVPLGRAHRPGHRAPPRGALRLRPGEDALRQREEQSQCC